MISKRDYTKCQIVNNKKVLYGKRQIQTDRQTELENFILLDRERERERELEHFILRERERHRESQTQTQRIYCLQVLKTFKNAAGTHSL